METGRNMEKISKNIHPVTTIEINQMLDELVKRNGYQLQMGNITITNQGEVEDTLNGKRQVFQIQRKVKW